MTEQVEHRTLVERIERLESELALARARGDYWSDLYQREGLGHFETIKRAEAAEQRVRELEKALRECDDQATQGIFIEHKCPAFYACCAIVSECGEALSASAGTPSKDQQQGVRNE